MLTPSPDRFDSIKRKIAAVDSLDVHWLESAISEVIDDDITLIEPSLECKICAAKFMDKVGTLVNVASKQPVSRESKAAKEQAVADAFASLDIFHQVYESCQPTGRAKLLGIE